MNKHLNEPKLNRFPHLNVSKSDYSDRESDFDRGIIYYLQDNKVKGILLWNASDYLERAREVLRAQPIITGDDSLKRLIALAPDSWLEVRKTEQANVGSTSGGYNA